MKILHILIWLSSIGIAAAQPFPFHGYDIYDYLVTAYHPAGCNPDYVTGLPNDSTWVNMSTNTVMTGYFGMQWMDEDGDELLLETSFNPDNYNVRLILEGGLFSNAVGVNIGDWIDLPQVHWEYIFEFCGPGNQLSTAWLLPMDFASFGVTATDIVIGVEITFLTTTGLPDLAGVYIITPPCAFLSLGPDVSLCPGETTDIDATVPGATYVWQDGWTGPIYQNAGPGVYWVEVTVDDCTLMDTIHVTEEQVNLNLGEDEVLCPGETMLLDATTPGATYNWHDGSSQPTYTVTQEGPHWVILSVNGCQFGDTIQVEFTDLPALDLGQDTLLCEGADLLLDVTTPGATYVWHNQSTVSTFLVVAPGTYAVTVTIDDCSISDEIDVLYVYPEPVNLGPDLYLCAGETIILEAFMPDATYLWQDGSEQPTYEVTQTGIYWVIVSLHGCTTGDMVEVEYSQETGPDLGSDFTLCPGETAILDASTPGGSYLWQDMSTGPTFTVSTAGVYSVTVNLGGCTFSDAVVVTSVTDLSTSLGPDTTLCQGESLVLDATTPNATYLWQDMSTGSTLNVDQPGTYWVLVTVDHCTTLDTIEVQFIQSVNINLGVDSILCPGESITLTASFPGATYLWQDQSVDSTLVVTAPGTYSVTVSVGNCSAHDTIQIEYANTLNVYLGNDTTLCQGENLMLDATIPGASYVWQDLSTSSMLFIDQPGNYWVAVFLNGCTASDTIQVSYLTLASSILGPDTTLCEGETLILDAQNPGAGFVWQDLSTQSTLQVDQPGTYWVEVSLNQCSIRDSIHVDYLSFIPIALGPDTTLCPGATLLLETNIPGASVQWQDLSTGPSLLVSSPGLYWVTVQLDACTNADTIEVAYAVMPSIWIGEDTTLCEGETLLLDAGPWGQSYQWQDHTTSQTLLVTQPGSYWVEVMVDQCALRDSIDIGYLVISSFTLGVDTSLCEGVAMLLDVTTPGATYLWQDHSTGATTTVTQAGQYWVDVVVGTCQVTDTIEVQYIDTPPVDLGPDTHLCSQETLTLDAIIPGASYVWQDGSTQSQLLVSMEGTYSVLVLLDQCTVTDTIHISILDVPSIDLGNDTSLCPGATLTLEANLPGVQYLWSDSSGSESLDVTQPGVYWLELSVGHCSTADTIVIIWAEALLFDLGADTVLCRGETLILDPGIEADVVYTWQNFSNASTFLVNEGGLYWLQVTDPCGQTSDTISIAMENCDCHIYVPNVFTPDGNSINDLFLPQASCPVTTYQLSIFDRAGGLLFETRTWGTGWDGLVHAEYAQVGVYVFLLWYSFEDGEVRSLYGDVTVVR